MILQKPKKNSIIIFFLYFYTFICVFFPLDPFNLKLLMFFLITLLSINDYIQELLSGKKTVIFGMGVLFPLLLVFMSFINTGQIKQTLSGAYPAVLILLLIPILKQEIDYERILCAMLLTEAVIIVGLVVLDLLHIYDVNQPTLFHSFYYRTGMGVMGKSDRYSAYYKIFFKTSPLLIYLLDNVWRKGKKCVAIVVVLALFFSGTRANFFVTFIYIVWRLIFNSSKNKKNRTIYSIGTIIILLMSMSYIFNVANGMMHTSGSISSDAVRSGQLIGLLNELSDPKTLVFGAGLGTFFFDYGRMSYMSGVELTYFDFLRQIGLIFFIPFIIFIFFPLTKRIPLGSKIAHTGYMAIAFTNPLLYTSTSFLAYIYMYYLVLRNTSQRCFLTKNFYDLRYNT